MNPRGRDWHPPAPPRGILRISLTWPGASSAGVPTFIAVWTGSPELASGEAVEQEGLTIKTETGVDMPKGYWIVRVDISDPERYKAYLAANVEPFAKYGARFLARAGRFEAPEGTSRARNAVLEFPSYQAALECWHSPEYQRALRLREPVSTMDLVIVEGYEP
jgi:uncharacterized protein (DUF1330 family)